jgi:uncharacterized protein (DUF885 family)
MLTRRTALATGFSALAAPALGAADDAYRAAISSAYGGDVDPYLSYAGLAGGAASSRDRLDGLLRGQGLRRGTAGERLAAFAKDPRWLYPDTDAGRDRAVSEMNARLAAMRPRLAEAFGDLPIAAAEVRRMTPADEAARRGGYRLAPKDGATGAYYVDLHAIRTRPSWSLPTVAFHEVTPGHLLQMPLEAAPPQRGGKAAPAFFEAWAIYAEDLAADLGAYRDDPRAEIGYLHWRLFRMARAMADIGLHAQGWSRDKAISIVRFHQGFDAAFIGIEADVERIIANPGKVAAEELGAERLLAWRPKDRAQWPAYHRLVLTEAPWPFGALERRLGDIARGAATPP